MRIAVGELIYEPHRTGGSLRRVQPDAQLFSARPRPETSLPPQPRIFGREDVLDTLRSTLELGGSVVLQGRPGGGTTSVLRFLAHDPIVERFPEGVVFLDGAGGRGDDLVQRVVEAFHVCDRPGFGLRMSDDEIDRCLADRQALVIIDHADVAQHHLERLAGLLPAGAVVLGTSVALTGPVATTIGLDGLGPAAAVELIGREFARPLNVVERSDVAPLNAALGGRPLSLVQAAARVRMERGTVQDPAPSPEIVVRDLLDHDRGRATTQVAAAAMAAFWPTRLNAAALSAVLSGPGDLDDSLTELVDLGLATGDEPVGHTIDPALIERIGARFDLTAILAAAGPRLVSWAETESSDEAIADVAPAAAHAAAWAIGAGRPDDAIALARAFERSVATTRRWQLWGELLDHAVHAASGTTVDPHEEAWAYHQAGTRALAVGHVDAGRDLLRHALRLRTSLGDDVGAAVTRANLEVVTQDRSRRLLAAGAGVSFLVAALLALTMALGGGGDADPEEAQPAANVAATTDAAPATTPAPPTTAAATSAPTTIDPLAPPPPPAGVDVAVTDEGVRVSWTPGGDDVAGYEIVRDGETVASISGPADDWVDDDATAGATHGYSVVALDADANRSLPSPPIAAEIPGTPAGDDDDESDGRGPTTPGSVTATVDPGGVIVTWAPSQDRSGIGSYVVRRDGADLTTAGPEATSAVDAAPVPGATHTYEVIALDVDGNPSASGGPATVTIEAADTTPPSAPGSIGLGQEPTSEPPAVVVSWGEATDNTGVVGYRILRSGAVAATTSADQRVLADPDWRSGRYGDVDGCGETFVDYAVEAFDEAGNTGPRVSFTVTLPPSC
ncbi:MAG: hypothetical protein AAFZ07_06775 [Actinomycetota bacterium]